MKRHGASIALGLLLLGCMAAASGCPFASMDPYPDDVPTGGGSGGPGSGGTGNTACGDGQVTGAEQCDDGNKIAGDGCDASCEIEGDCWDCSTAGAACTAIAAGMSCGQGLFCDSQDNCVPCVASDEAAPGCGAVSGTECTVGTECASGNCIVGVCRRAVGEPYDDDVQCATNRCDSSTQQCAPCQVNGDCKSKECNNNACKAALGEPCDQAFQCNSSQTSCTGVCLLNIGGSCSMDAACITKLCDNGKCAACTQACPGNVTCLGGICQIGSPSGSYCIADTDCANQTCTGFPRKCL